MPSPNNTTNITPPRVPLIDERSGFVSREWYRFFLSLFRLTGSGANVTSLTDLQLGPPAPQQEDLVDIIIDVEATKIQPTEESANEQIAELAKQVEGLAATPIPALGTFAALQQANLPWTTFDTTPEAVPSVTTGTLYWDNEERAKTLALVMEDTGDIIQDIGEDTFYRVKATATITKGQVLMFTGTVGASGGLLAAPATGLTAFQGEYILGIATQNIALNGWGYATWFGEISKVNTTGGVEAWVDGQILYYNPAVTGGLTKNVPTAPNPKVIVASVVHAATNGILFVRPTFGSALGATDSNVEITSLTNGDLLQYDSGQARWENVPASTLPVGTATNLAGGATGSVPYQSASSTTAMLPIGTALQVLKVNAGATAPQWVSGAALTEVDDTNVTLTLGGSPSTALLAATSLTLGWTGQLATSRGGTGLSSYTANGVVYASSTSALATGSALTFDGTNFATTGSATATAFIPSSSTIPTNGLYLSAANTVAFATDSIQRFRIASTGQATFTVANMTAANPSAFVVNSTGKAAQTGTYTGLISTVNTDATYTGAGSIISVYADIGSFSVAPTNVYGFYVPSGFTGATNNYGFYSTIASAANRWNFFANGTANNAYAGNSRFGGVTAPTVAVDVTGAVLATGNVTGGYNNPAAGTTAMAFGSFNVVRVTPNANATYTTTVPAAGTRLTLIILTSGVTPYTITFGTGFKTTGTLATGVTSARYFMVSFVSDGTNVLETARTIAIA